MRASVLILVLLPALLALAPVHGHGVFCETTANWPVHHYAPPAPGSPFRLGPIDTCTGGDGHGETGLGGAWLAAGPGSLACYGEPAHHPAFGSITSWDDLLGAGATMEVGIDTSPGCGDFLIDQSVLCIQTCHMPFAPGPDGVYHVFLTGGMGDIYA